MSENESRVVRVIADEVGQHDKELRPELRLAQDLGFDSLDSWSLLCALEEEFSIEISDEDARKLQTVKDVCEYVERQVNAVLNAEAVTQ